ncbi:hypothetical protein [Desulforegula conservatrix]|uniref:hypothetical protein n=1 Tax=Desulforegula conservatrix TaxID=153026 RepID=UPI0003F69FB5|nr:hypothetical protein [Desulforegula conservatrix]
MTTIHNIGIVIQQSSAVVEAQQVKHHQTDPSNIAASHQFAKDLKEQSTVMETEGSEKAALREREEGSKGNLHGRHEDEKKDKNPEEEEKTPDSAGYIIDTVA